VIFLLVQVRSIIMTTGHVFLATSLDGFVARKNHSLDWLDKANQSFPKGEDGGYGAFIKDLDGIIMGRGSFNTILGFGFWPYSIPVIVLSSSLSATDIPNEYKHKVQISRSTPNEIMAEVAELGWKRAYIDGGALIQSFIREGLVKDITLTIIPVLLGSGISLFGSIEKDIELELISSKQFHAGIIQNSYRFLYS
jgi:dihydrofolate reductase